MSAVAITVCGERRSRELTIPRAVRISEVLPSIAHEVDGSASTEATLSTVSGEPLDVGLTADEAGLYDGQLLTLSVHSSDAEVRVFDDPAAAIAARVTAATAVAPRTAATTLAVLGLVGVLCWLIGSKSLSITVLATVVAAAAACLPFIPALCLRIGGISTRLDLPHDATSLADEESAVHRAAALAGLLESSVRVAVGLGSGLVAAAPHPATVITASCALAATALRQRLTPRPVASAVVVLAAAYGGIVLTPLVLQTRPGAAQLWMLAALTVAAAGLGTFRARPLPGLARLTTATETVCRSALLPAALWVWGMSDAVLSLVRS